MKGLLSVYRPLFSRAVIYMLQSTEYQAGAYLRWLGRIRDFRSVMYRRQLVMTRAANILLRSLRLGMLAQIAVGIFWGIRAARDHAYARTALDAVIILAAPLVWAYLIILPLWLARIFIMKPMWWWQIRQSSRVFKNHPGAKIAIAGSYGKTTMKELLQAVLSAGQKVAATPGNKNVAVSHAQFAKRLTGDEEILLIEYGEGAPGDVAKFTKRTHPNMGIITGLAPAHLDKYSSLEAAGRDIFSLADKLEGGEVYVNTDSSATRGFMKPAYIPFSNKGVAGWKVSKVKTDFDGLSFTLKKGKQNFSLHSLLIGRHLVAPLALCVYLAVESGMNKEQIEDAVRSIKPFEHRMQPYRLNGAQIIDDTYNGNIEGMRAGLALLKDLPASRKIYITPGLVDQGVEEAGVHLELGDLIAKANPDVVVLMKNSVTDYIRHGMKDYKGQLIIEDDPLNFYTHLDKFVASGDLVLMQNDWTDNYA